MNSRSIRLLLSLAGLALLTLAVRGFPINATTVGFAYLLLVLVVASAWGFIEAFVTSVAATICYNLFFLPPVGNLTIADPQNWIALFTFLTTSLIASRLSAKAKRRALDAIERQQDLERLYSFSRGILLIGESESFGGELIRNLAAIFGLDSAVLYDKRTGAFYKAGPLEMEGLEEQLRESALRGTTFSNDRSVTFTPIRLGSEPIASLAIHALRFPDSLLEGIANLVAIGLERARAQALAHEIEVTRRGERLRTTLIDTMAHEFKTPLTAITATTTLLLDSPNQSQEDRMELLRIADEEAHHLRALIDDTLTMARLDAGHIKVNPEAMDFADIVEDVRKSLKNDLQSRTLDITKQTDAIAGAFDRRLVELAIKQLLDNAIKYSPPGTPLRVQVRKEGDRLVMEVTDFGKGIPIQEQDRIFERFYRSPSVAQIPGSGLGLSIAQSIARAHGGDLTVTSCPGETAFKLILPLNYKGDRIERGKSSCY